MPFLLTKTDGAILRLEGNAAPMLNKLKAFVESGKLRLEARLVSPTPTRWKPWQTSALPDY
jgi:hypothetical protein